MGTEFRGKKCKVFSIAPDSQYKNAVFIIKLGCNFNINLGNILKGIPKIDIYIYTYTHIHIYIYIYIYICIYS